jgi:hypothetical protein
MPMVQAEILRVVSLLGDSPGIFLRSQSSRRPHSWLTRDRDAVTIQGFYETQADPTGELAPLRSMQPKQIVSFCQNSTRRKSGRGLMMGGFSRDMH